MAGWRSRGYVADSDEEEASQDSSPWNIPTTSQSKTVGDDIGEEEEQDVGKDDHDLATDVNSPQRQEDDITDDSEFMIKDVGQHPLEKPFEATVAGGGNSVPVPITKHSREILKEVLVSHAEDIDELQEDHYKAIPAARPRFRLPGELREKAATIEIDSQTHILGNNGSSPASRREDSDGSPRKGTEATDLFRNGQRKDKTVDDPNSPRMSLHDSLSPLRYLPQIQEDLGPRRGSRTLRQRNPIQLHPYAIESEKYRQVLKARGLKPLRMAQMEAEAAMRIEEDSQNMEYQAGQSQSDRGLNDQEDMRSSPPLLSQGSVTTVTDRTGDDFVFGEEDLPSVHDILNNPSRTYTKIGHKRRKNGPPTFRLPPGASKSPQRVSPTEVTNGVDDDEVLFDVPPSPPPSGTQTPLRSSVIALPSTRANGDVTQNSLPTPITSSEPRRPPIVELSENESDPSSHKRNHGSGSDDSLSIDESSHQLQRVQRKIRGVLPASWLKLDLKGRKPGHVQGTHQSPSPKRNKAQRGVARPIAGAKARPTESPDPLDSTFLSSEDEDSPNHPRVVREQSTSKHHSHSEFQTLPQFGEDRWGQAAEEDHIDGMLPSASRARPGGSRKGKKRQSKLGDLDLPTQSTPGAITKRPSNHYGAQTKITDQFDKDHKRKPKFRPPKLSILDAQSPENTIQRGVPTFLKVAARTARSRNDKGRHSPSKKYLRLATKHDDQDAKETLRNWREGTIMQRSDTKIKRAESRQPLYPRSDNNSLPPRVNNHRGKNIKAKPAIHQKRSLTSRTVPARSRRRLQSSLDDLVERRGRATSEGLKTVHQQTIEQPKQGKHLETSVRTHDDSRPAMLELSQPQQNETHAQGLFQQDLSRINRFDDESGLPNVLRLLQQEKRPRPVSASAQNSTASPLDRLGKPNPTGTKVASYRMKKRRPQRVDTSILWSRPGGTSASTDSPIETSQSCKSPKNFDYNVILGLGSFGARYSDNFNAFPLPTGIYLPANTLIGSGLFAQSLRLEGLSSLDKPRGSASLQFRGRTYIWGPWNDAVSTELGDLLSWVSQAIRADSVGNQEISSNSTYEEALSLLAKIIAYFSEHLSFFDSVDRMSFIQRCKDFMSASLLQIDGEGTTRMPDRAIRLRFSILRDIFANQIRQISRHEIVTLHLQDEVRSKVGDAIQQTLELFMSNNDNIEGIINANGHVTKNKQSTVQALVIAYYIIGQTYGTSKDFWRMTIWNIPMKRPNSNLDAKLLEISWKRLFHMLPLLEFDVQGVLETGRRFKVPLDNWVLVKKLVGPILEASLKNPRRQASSFNAYCRALFGRCLNLINGWGWQRCESIIGTLFDFFTHNNLSHLRNEESHGSPLFLEQLADRPALTADPGDQCFHLLLKIIGSGLKHMRAFYSEKKMRDIVWRLMPNHGRSHPKEKAIRQGDLDALRNHHDLICTLYWASPPSCRPRLRVIRNLVHLESSHREACHINIRAWLNLVKYQLSTDEPATALKPFAEWHDDVLSQLLRQHSLARSEAEDQIRSIQHVGGIAISKEQLESTIAGNQQQVEVTISDALVSLKLAIYSAPDGAAISVLMSANLTMVFDLYDSGKHRTGQLVMQALEIVQAFIEKNRSGGSPNAASGSDDSQDYGDWPAFDAEDDSPVVNAHTDAESPLSNFQDPLRQLLSNCFGSDIVPDDALLRTLIDVWVSLAQQLVHVGTRSWADYIDRFGSNAWSSLRETEQTRKYTAYYLASLMETDNAVYTDHKFLFLTSWLGLIVERESLLKFQHRLTEAVLDADCGHPMLGNLPFCKSATTGRFVITAEEFSERRLSLISTVLSNMRVSLEQAIFDPAVNAMQRRQEYKDLLKSMMAKMKHNYQELGQGSNVRGAYVDFVHRVVELLQQHTSAICPIDRFFTDNGAFPLPATDPTYVVGQLKNYALRLQDSKIPKQLAVFLQSVSERAAIDGQQAYLVGQLHTSISNAFESGDSRTPTLRAFIVKAIAPAYIELACTSVGASCGWIIALPFLQALQKTFQDLLLDLNGTDLASITSMASIITTFLASVQVSFGNLLPASSILKEAGILKLVSACYAATTAILPTLDYIIRLGGPTQQAIKDLEFLKAFAAYITALLKDQHEPFSLDINAREDPTEFQETRNFAKQELKEMLNKNWTYNPRDQLYYVTRGSSRRELVVDIGLYEEERAELFRSLGEFGKCIAALPALCDEDDELEVAFRDCRVREDEFLMI